MDKKAKVSGFVGGSCALQLGGVHVLLNATLNEAMNGV
jgi:hypothetical protein